jgi:hypothetical protein
MLQEFNELKTKVDQLKGRRDLLVEQKRTAEINKELDEKYLENLLKARTVVQIVAEQTQKQLEYHISNLVTMALSSVFPDPYKFELRFVQRRNKTEADLIFSKNGNETDDILNSGGGGVADVASIALQISLWSIKKTRPLIILDEKTKFLHSPLYQEKCSELLKEVCDKLGLQMIIVTDQVNMIKAADNVIKVLNVNGQVIIEGSKVKQEKIEIKRRKK